MPREHWEGTWVVIDVKSRGASSLDHIRNAVDSQVFLGPLLTPLYPLHPRSQAHGDLSPPRICSNILLLSSVQTGSPFSCFLSPWSSQGILTFAPLSTNPIPWL